MVSLVSPSAIVVMASGAWSAYRVLGPPFFVVVDGGQEVVVSEGVAWSTEQVAGHVSAAMAGLGRPRRATPRRRAVPGARGQVGDGVHSELLDIRTDHRTLSDLTSDVTRFCRGRGDGLCHVFVPLRHRGGRVDGTRCGFRRRL